MGPPCDKPMITENYFNWRNEVLPAFLLSSGKAEIIHLIEQQTIKLGLTFYALYIRHPIPFTRPKIFVFSNYPKKWLEKWQAENLAESDPIICYCQTPGTLLLWDDPRIPAGNPVFMAAQEYGIRSGISYSRMAKNRALGILSMASGKSFEKIDLTTEKQLKLQYLSDLVLDALQRINDISMSVMNMALSKRETEILKWTAEGKTSAEISLILDISENTVNFHQKKMQKRFNAPNKTQMASYAAAIGLL